MNENQNSSQLTPGSKSEIGRDVTFSELFIAIWEGKRLLFSLAISFSLLFLIVTLFFPNKYESKALLAPVQSEDSSQSLQGYSGLASLAGIDLPGAETSKTTKALEKVVSLSFFADHIMPNIFMPDLMALDKWDPQKNEISYKLSKYNIDEGVWKRKPKFPRVSEPSAQEGHKEFLKIIKIKENDETGFVNLSIKHQSPFIARKWAEIVVLEINDWFRETERKEAQIAIDYLNTQLAQTNFSEIKLALAELVQKEMQKLTLIEANEYYVLKYIDPPVVAEEKSSPLRALITILGGIFGVLVGTFLVLRKYFTKIDKQH